MKENNQNEHIDELDQNSEHLPASEHSSEDSIKDGSGSYVPVSYTHLDVYKRQVLGYPPHYWQWL